MKLSVLVIYQGVSFDKLVKCVEYCSLPKETFDVDNVRSCFVSLQRADNRAVFVDAESSHTFFVEVTDAFAPFAQTGIRRFLPGAPTPIADGMKCFTMIMLAYRSDTNRQVTGELTQMRDHLFRDMSQQPDVDTLRTKCGVWFNNMKDLYTINIVHGKLDKVKDLMSDNIELALQNSVKIDSITKAAEELQQSAGMFHRRSHQLRRTLWWRNIRYYLIVGGIVLIVLGIIVAVSVSTTAAKN